MDRGKRIVLFVFIVCAVGGGWYTVYYRPLQRDIRRLEQEVITRREGVEEGWRVNMTAPDLENRAGEAQARLALRKATFPSLGVLPDMMRHLGELSDLLDLRLIYAEPLEVISEGVQNTEGIGILPIRLHVEGSFLAVGKYLTTLADLPYFAGFGEFRCGREEEQLSIEATAEVYVYVVKNAAYPVEKTISSARFPSDTPDQASKRPFEQGDALHSMEMDTLSVQYSSGQSTPLPRGGAGEHGEGPLQTMRQVKQHYSAARSAYQQKDFTTAIGKFNAILDTPFPHPLKDNAQYWIGECYYAQEHYERALTEFERVPVLYPKGNKVLHAQIKMVYCYAHLNWHEQARALLARLAQEHPQDPAVRRASAIIGQTKQGDPPAIDSYTTGGILDSTGLPYLQGLTLNHHLSGPEDQ